MEARVGCGTPWKPYDDAQKHVRVGVVAATSAAAAMVAGTPPVLMGDGRVSVAAAGGDADDTGTSSTVAHVSISRDGGRGGGVGTGKLVSVVRNDNLKTTSMEK